MTDGERRVKQPILEPCPDEKTCFLYMPKQRLESAPMFSQQRYYIILILNLLAIFCGCLARFVSDLVGTPEDRFSHDAAHFKLTLLFFASSILPF